MDRTGRGHPMGLHVRRSDHGELVRGAGVGHVRDVGGGRPGMVVVGDHVHEVGEVLRRKVVVVAAAGHGARMDHPRVPQRELRWAGLGPRTPGLEVEREVHDGRELHVCHHGVGKAGTATDPKGCQMNHLFRCRGCHRRQGD